MTRVFLFSFFVATLATSFGGGAIANAKVIQLEVATKVPYGSFRAGDYVVWEGRVTGELSPGEAIPNIDKANRNARGLVDYAARITLLMPADPAKGNGALLVDIPNRGKPYAHALYNTPRDEPFSSGTFEQGTGFLEDQGFSIVAVHWELGQGAELPRFTDGDGKTKYVEGAGLAIIRDAADFFAHAAADISGTPNPLKGAISRTLAAGKSQSGLVLRTLLFYGYNVAEGRRVFDGMHIFVSWAGVLPKLQSGTGPTSSTNDFPTYDDPDFRGVIENPLTIGDLIKVVENRGEVPPRIVLINTTTDYLAGRASLSRTGAEGTVDQPIPSNVRVYDIAGSSHVVVGKADCKLPVARLDWSPISRATLLRLDDWIAHNAEPPTSQLMSLEPSKNDPNVVRAPSHFATAVVQVPRRDADGNSLGGVRLPDLAVPLGVHALQNQPLSRGCMLVGSYRAFAKTREERERLHDELPSIAERYRNRNDYVSRIRNAARQLGAAGFLLPEDEAIIVHSAAETTAFK